MEFKEYFLVSIGLILALCGFFMTRWVNRINEDRREHLERADFDRESMDRRIIGLERECMDKEDAQKWITRLDRQREALEKRIEVIERNTLEKQAAYAIYQDMKRDINQRFAELREDVKIQREGKKDE